MKVALFSDVHGRLRMVLYMIRNWQITHGTHLDGTLLAGDVGCFPDPSTLDKATRRWIERDPEEAGFSKYFTTPHAAVQLFFDPDCGDYSAIRCPILFVPGNHEDYAYLSIARRKPPAPGAPPNTFPVDCYDRFHAIHDGAIVSLHGEDGSSLRVAGVWGIEQARPRAPYRIKTSVVQQLRAQGSQSFDLLLTHDVPAEGYPTGGSTLVTEVIRSCNPMIHLFGHAHPIKGRHEFSVPGSTTTSIVFNGLAFRKSDSDGLLGAMGVLTWNGSEFKTEIVQDNWIKQMRFQNWESVWPEGAVP